MHMEFYHDKMGNTSECVKHLKVLASAGDKESMDGLMEAYKDNELSKEDLTQTLRAFQASSNEMKSKDRDDARLLDESGRRGEAPPAHLLIRN